MGWNNVQGIQSKSFVCSFCGNQVASEAGWYSSDVHGQSRSYIYLCHLCGNPSYFDRNGKQYPGVPYGGTVKHISETGIEQIYEEARNCMKVSLGCVWKPGPVSMRV